MSGQIDVLAVLDRLEDYYRRHEVLIGPVDDAYSVEHKAARLAVAELIAAASDPAVHVRGNGIRGWQRHCEAIARLRTALANAGGAK